MSTINISAVHGRSGPNRSKRFQGAFSMHHYITLLRSVSIQNQYLEWYCKIVHRGLVRANTRIQAKIILGYSEGHHIVPRSYKLGGETDKDNIVYLSAKEHVILHRLLCKFSQGAYRTSMLYAFHIMCFNDNGGNNKRYTTTHLLGKARAAVSVANSGPRGIIGAPKWSNCDNIEEFKSLLIDHVKSQKSDPEIGKIYGVSATAVFNWRTKLDVGNRRPLLKDSSWLYEQYVTNKLSAAQIGIIVGSTGAAVQQYLNRFGIPIRDANARHQQNR